MVTLQTADNALKTFYLDAISAQMDGKITPLLSMIEKTSAYVTGKGISKAVRTSESQGVGAGTETGDLPKAKEGAYLNFNLPLKNLYGTIEITDKAIRASANAEGAFVNLLNDEMQGLIKSAKYNFSRMLFGDGTGVIGECEVVDGNVLTLTSVEGLRAGACVDIYDGNAPLHFARRVLAVDYATNEITLEASTSSEPIYEGFIVAFAGAQPNCELTGLKAIFANGALYGVNRENPYMRPYKQASVGEITVAKLQKAVDEVEEQSGGKVNVIVCSRGVRRAIVEHCRENQVVLSTTQIGEDPSVMTFNGIPVLVDDFCPKGTIYLLNTNDFKLCQLCDWQWMEGEDGKILKQIAGKPVYTATLVKYAELLCEKPCGQGMLSGITEA